MNGVLVVDKPAGMTSHAAVKRLRRAAGLRRIGHAGTLDPMATGVLVAMLGEATKLGPYLTAADKSYLARIALGAETDTLDADGEIVRQATIPAWWDPDRAAAPAEVGLAARFVAPDEDRLEAALAAERGRREQIPPAFSAVKLAGRAAHLRARRGEPVDLEPRPVAVREIRVLSRDPAGFELSLRVTKGYYVRALARDLGQALGCPAHLAALRRTASGPFGIDRARPLAELADPAAIAAALITLARAACLALPSAVLNEDAVPRARSGQRLASADFAVPPEAGRPSAWIDGRGELVAIGRGAARMGEGHAFSVVRGFDRAREPTGS